MKVSVAMIEAGVNALAATRINASDEKVVHAVFTDMMKAHNREEADKRREPAPAYRHREWPSWRFGPGDEALLCQNEGEVPAGWADSPEAAAALAETKKAPAQKRAA